MKTIHYPKEFITYRDLTHWKTTCGKTIFLREEITEDKRKVTCEKCKSILNAMRFIGAHLK